MANEKTNINSQYDSFIEAAKKRLEKLQNKNQGVEYDLHFEWDENNKCLKLSFVPKK